MTYLSVNITKVAALRNLREGKKPDILKIVADCEAFGAGGITVCPGPNDRHVRYADIYDLKPLVKTVFNLEGFPSDSFIDLALKIKPTQVTLVPDVLETITSGAGWNVKENFDKLNELIEVFTSKGIRTSIFVEADLAQIETAAKTGTDRVVLNAGFYSELYEKDKDAAIAPYVESVRFAKSLGLGVNACHNLNLENLAFFKQNVPVVEEVSIGHALICDALYCGLKEAVFLYNACLK